MKRPEPALCHAQRCLEICQQNDIGDFAYEALARAHAVAGDAAECEKNLARAKEAGEGIKKEDDKQYFFRELETIACAEK